MKFLIKVSNEDGSNGAEGKPFWWEDYDKENVISMEEIHQFGYAVAEYWNSTLRPHEKRRKYLGEAEIVGEATPRHDWHKVTVMSQSDKDGIYDIYHCTKCGITGRRYGVAGVIRRDHKYRANKYLDCVRPKQ